MAKRNQGTGTAALSVGLVVVALLTGCRREPTPLDSRQQLSRAIVLGIGFGRTMAPQYDRARLVAEFGAEQSAKLEPLVLALQNEMRALDVDWKTQTLATAGEWARLEMHRRHPGLSDDALRALEWQFTFDSR